MKWLGAGVLTLVGVWIGMMFVYRQQRRVKLLARSLMWLREFERRIRYTATPVREWLEESKIKYSDLPFVDRMLFYLRTEALEVAWKDAMTEVSDLQKSDIDILCSLGSHLGKSDVSVQLQCIDETLEALEEQSRAATAFSQKTEKMYLALGASGGLVLALLLL